MYGLIVVDVCESNAACRQELFELESKYPEVSVLESMCMSNCDTCATFPYVLLNGEMVVAQTWDELLTDLTRRIEKIIESYAETST